MFIELAELLICPGNHEQMPCVVVPEKMDGRRVVRGGLGCPVCEAEHPIVDGVACFGNDPLLAAGSRSDDLTLEELPDGEAVRALLDLSGPGGYVMLVGSGCRLAEQLAELVDSVHFVGLNPPPELRESSGLSLVRSPYWIPMKDNAVRGILVGREFVRNRWMDEAGRVLAKGGRLVAVVEQIAASGVEQLAMADRMWVGEKKTGEAPAGPGCCSA